MANNKTFVRKGYGAEIYKWSVVDNKINADKALKKNNDKRPFYCTATPNSKGQDWVTTYTYDLVVVNSQQQHLAYVECDYVQ